MKIILMLTLLTITIPAYADKQIKLDICSGEYALCAASSTEPTGRSITVGSIVYSEGKSVCPVLSGKSIANLDLMNGSCKAPAGKVWSLFSAIKSYPQAPSWAVAPAAVRTFVTTAGAGGGMSNQWSFLCTKQRHKTNGVQLADCLGPLNESPWNNKPVPVGATVVTAAPIGAPNPVGGNVP